MKQAAEAAAAEAEASHLRTSSEVIGYHIAAADGEIGHVDDLLVDDRTWVIRLVRVDTSNWIGGKAVLVPRSALTEVRWSDRTLGVALTRGQIRESPEFDPSRLTPEFEERVERYYAGL